MFRPRTLRPPAHFCGLVVYARPECRFLISSSLFSRLRFFFVSSRALVVVPRSPFALLLLLCLPCTLLSTPTQRAQQQELLLIGKRKPKLSSSSSSTTTTTTTTTSSSSSFFPVWRTDCASFYHAWIASQSTLRCPHISHMSIIYALWEVFSLVTLKMLVKDVKQQALFARCMTIL